MRTISHELHTAHTPKQASLIDVFPLLMRSSCGYALSVLFSVFVNFVLSPEGGIFRVGVAGTSS